MSGLKSERARARREQSESVESESVEIESVEIESVESAPSIDESSVLVEQANRVFTALADPTRRQVLQLLSEIQPASASAISGHLPVSRQAIVQHLSVLQQSELVVSRRAGREVLFSLRPEALTQTASWMNALASNWSERLQRLKRLAEAAEATQEAAGAAEESAGPAAQTR